jgi:uncharacterized membrane protein
MTDSWIYVLTLAAALGSGLLAGLFYAFSSFVMKGLADLPPAQGIAAMNSINAAVQNPVFMLGFLGTPAICLAAGVAAVVRWGRPGSTFLLIGSVLYLVGAFVLTVAFHIPRNNALAALDPASPSSVEKWTNYVSVWTAGNHVRTLTALAAAAFFTAALRQLR